MRSKVLRIGIVLLLGVIGFSCSQNDDSSDQTEGLTENKIGFAGNLKEVYRLGGAEADNAAAIVNLEEGGIAILATTFSTNGDVTDKIRAGEDYWLLRMDAEGQLLWSKTYGGSGGDVATDLVATKDGGFLLGGYSMSIDGDASKNEGFHDNWFVKTDASGNVEWEKSYGFAGHDHSYSVIQTQDGGYFSAGFLDVTASGGAGNENSKHGIGEFWGQKLDSNGNLEWRNYFGGTNNDRAYSVQQTPDGDYALFGFTESTDFDITNSQGSYDFWVVKLNASGTMLWQKTYGGSGVDQAYDAIMMDNGDFLVVGQTLSADGDISNALGGSDAWVIRINASGNMVWEQNYGGTDFEFAKHITAGPNNTFFIVGNSRSADLTEAGNAGENDIWAFQIDVSGEVLWQQTYGGSGIDLGVDAVFSATGILNLLGTSESAELESKTGFGAADLILLQID